MYRRTKYYRPRALLGDAPQGPQYTNAQLINMSHADLINIMQQDQAEIAYIDADLAANAQHDPAYQYDAATIASINAVKMQYQVQVATIQAWLNLSQTQQAQANVAQFFQNTASQFLNSYQNAVQYAGGTTPTTYGPPGTTQAGFDLGFLNNIYFGLPLWGWGLAAGGLYYVLSKR